MRQLREQLALAARTQHPVLITGETGVGKELVALELHRLSARSGSFVPVNVCASSETLFESAMFGHERGAFTGAVRRLPGYMRESNHGTLFLDEISSLGHDSQVKLLRAVESRRFRPVGAQADSASDFWLLSASNRDLPQEVDAGRFRADLYFRLFGFELEVPPLRERIEDIPLLVRHFLRAMAAEGAGPVDIDDAVIDRLTSRSWPGNVRELQRAVVRMSLRAAGASTITCHHLDQRKAPERMAETIDSNREADTARSLARQKMVECLMRHAWDTRAVANELSVSRKTVYERMKRAGIASIRRAQPSAISASTAIPDDSRSPRSLDIIDKAREAESAVS